MGFWGKRVWKNLIICFTNVTAFRKFQMIIQNLTQILSKKVRPKNEQFKTLISGRGDLLKIYQQLRIRYPHTQTSKTFVETGTFSGETVRRMEPFFERLVTMEIGPKHHQVARDRHPSPKILCVLGDSVTELRKICQELSHPIFLLRCTFFRGGYWQRGEGYSSF